ncbi:MAG: asparagine synthase (glutamine-hydrolyzing) [Acidobacteriota bacterium]|nr:asparagine synthase (glutamine-hydrolyzing) [Acidobacteriota bacterium]
MCGVAGIWRRDGAERDDPQTVERMLAGMVHRGPDDQGLIGEDQVTLGHRRLAIIDLSPSGRQPMVSPGGRLVVSFNGEIYNHRELLGELGLDPRELRSTSDTEILLAAWERWGEAALDRLVGPFAFALHDRRARRTWLVRDRLGEKPLFFHADAGRVAFASTLGALLLAPGVPRDIDRGALEEYLTLRYVVAPRTILRDVQKLPPGHLLVLEDNRVESRRWWHPARRMSLSRPSKRDVREAVEQFDALLAQACRRCLVSDRPVALLLSDGIDSQALHHRLNELGSGVRALTFFPATDNPTDEGRAFREQARRQAELIEARPEEILQVLPRVFASLAEPVGDGASLPTWLMIHHARERAVVFLCGHGGDEVLAGYRLSQERFRLAALRRLGRWPLPVIDGVIDRYTYGPESLEERKRRLLAASPAQVPQAGRYLIHRPLPLDDLRGLVGGEPREPYLGTIDRLYEGLAAEGPDLQRMRTVLLETFLASNILSFADSVSMDSSAELRLPYLDRDLVAFALTAPRDLLISRWPGHANTKLLLRRWSAGRLDPAITTRKKRTFNYGNLRGALSRPKERRRLLELLEASPPLAEALPGLGDFAHKDPEFFHGPREGTLWALLALCCWERALPRS